MIFSIGCLLLVHHTRKMKDPEKLMNKVKNPDFYTKVYQNDQFTLYQKNTNS